MEGETARGWPHVRYRAPSCSLETGSEIDLQMGLDVRFQSVPPTENGEADCVEQFASSWVRWAITVMPV